MPRNLTDTRNAYGEQGYTLLDGLISREVADVFLSMTQKSMGKSVADFEKFADEPDIIEKKAYELYGFHFPPALSLAWGLTPFMEEATGVALYPTYAYFRVYQKGARCKAHSDRFSCEHSVTMTLGSSDGESWPFMVGGRRLTDTDVETRAITDDFGDDPYSTFDLAPGDGLLYQGIRYRHARLKPNPNRWSAHIFMHWVGRDGPYKDYIFDGKKIPRDADFPFR